MKELDRQEAFELASPYPYVLIVTLDKRERPNIMGLSWWMFSSWSPLMVAVSVGHKRYSHECLEHHGEFVLCFPSEGQEKDSWICGSKSGSEMDKFKDTGFKAVPSKSVKPPAIDGATVSFECKVVDQVESGDHTVYIADVVAIHGNPEKVMHLYSIHYTKLISIGCNGKIKMDLEY
ncbi:MAG: flavin reductase family protein [Nitrospirae bacterium]|nr:flavin reductase family protein [Nitrospirota bacterium]